VSANPRYAPDFTVRLAGEQLPPAMRACVVSVRYQDGLRGADRVELTVANDRLRWLDHPLLQLDTGFELRMGYAPDPLETVFVGEVTGIDATFPSGGMPTLTVVAHDFLERLTAGTKDREFALSLPCIGKFPLPDPVVASLVSATNALIPVIDPAGAALSFLTLLVSYAIDPVDAAASVRIQHAQSDFDFLAGLAKENGWEMSIDHEAEPKGYVLRFRFLLSDPVPALGLRWGESLVDFTPRISSVGQIASVAARIWISAIQTEIVIVLGWDYDRASFDLQIYPGTGDLASLLGDQQSRDVLVIDGGGPATVPKRLLSELIPRLNERLTASGTTVGDPRIKAGRVVDLDGLGDQFSGFYRITSSTHNFDGGGYRTTFDVRKEVWFDAVPRPKAPGRVRVPGLRLG
jgi:hypothetical protein